MNSSMTSSETKSLSELVQGIPVVMLTTIEPSGNLKSRPMAAPHIEGEGEMWFFALENSTKVEDVRKFPQVCITFVSSAENRYVSVTGRARVESDRQKRQELWSPHLKSWFPNGLEDPELTLLRITVERAESWDSNKSFLVQLHEFSGVQPPPKSTETPLEKKLH